ncbi:hypothetical protein HFV02_09750 [Acidithiobacillus caldus]|uniref:hypothetical protein n=1 Tax=Acidithiobacillus caldus TaxID=33059 RepID=UPI001C06AFBA|nr:hypothetical protein [Acidithiobacillus caldus]MBU2802533.1 hypothetical protein [Acidithiobacillus caldus]
MALQEPRARESKEYHAFEVSDADLCGDALTRGAENLLEQAARAVNAVPDEEDADGNAREGTWT